MGKKTEHIQTIKQLIKVCTGQLLLKTLKSSSDSEGEIPERKTTFWGALSTRSVDHGATHRQIDGLLKVLREFGHPEVPLTARTLLGTTASIAVQEKSGMKYIFWVLVHN